MPSNDKMGQTSQAKEFTEFFASLRDCHHLLGCVQKSEKAVREYGLTREKINESDFVKILSDRALRLDIARLPVTGERFSWVPY